MEHQTLPQTRIRASSCSPDLSPLGKRRHPSDPQHIPADPSPLDNLSINRPPFSAQGSADLHFNSIVDGHLKPDPLVLSTILRDSLYHSLTPPPDPTNNDAVSNTSTSSEASDLLLSSMQLDEHLLSVKPCTSPTTATVARNICVHGQTLPTVDAGASEHTYIAVADIFKVFYSQRYHWDEFKAELEKSHIPPRVVFTGVDSVDVLTETELNALLSRSIQNSAEKASQVSNSTDKTAPRTRHSDHNEIIYLTVNERSVPVIVLREEQFVRLVDVEHILLGTSTVRQKHLKFLKSACDKLGIPITKCSSNEKAKLVVYAKSFRHNSLHVIPAKDVERLYKRELSARPPPEPERLSYSPSNDGVSETLSGGSDDENNPDSTEQSFAKRNGHVNGDDGTSPPSSPVADIGRSATAEQQLPSTLVDTPSSSSFEKTQSRGQRKRRIRQASSTLVWRLCDLHEDLDLGATVELETPSVRPCNVVLSTSPALPVVICSEHGLFGPQGKVFNHLFVSELAACVLCVGCRTFYGVAEFCRDHARHAHNYTAERPVLCLFVDDPRRARFDLWRTFNQRLKHYGLSRFCHSPPSTLGVSPPSNASRTSDASVSSSPSTEPSPEDRLRPPPGVPRVCSKKLRFLDTLRRPPMRRVDHAYTVPLTLDSVLKSMSVDWQNEGNTLADSRDVFLDSQVIPLN